MNRLTVKLMILAITGILAACGGGGGGDNTAKEPAPAATPAPTDGQQGGTADVAEAEKLYNQTCAGCHAADLSGSMGPGLKQIGSKYSKDEIIGIIENGIGRMPPGLLKGNDAEAVAAWLSEMK